MDSQEITNILDDVVAQAAWRRPDSVIHDCEDWFQVITPSSRLYPQNGIYRAILKADQADGVIEKAIRDYRENQSAFRWIVTGATRPVDMADRLQRSGFDLLGEALGLAAPTDEVLKLMNTAVRVVDLVEADIDPWLDAFIAGWEKDESHRTAAKIDALQALRDRDSKLRYFSAFIGDKIVGTATLYLASHSVHLIGSSVLPDFRGRGVYRALVARRAQIGLEHGLVLVTTHGRVDTSAPILKKIGFKHHGQYTALVHGASE